MRLSLVIIIICAVLMSAINIFLSDRYAKKSKANALKNVSNQVNILTAQYTKNYMQDANYLYQISLDQLAEYAEGTIMIVDTSGKLFASSTTDKYLPDTLDISSYREVLKGTSTYRTGGFNYIFGYNTFSVASPFDYNGSVAGIIFIITKNEFLSEETLAASSMTMFSVAIAIIFALLTSYFLSKRLVRPLKKIGSAARYEIERMMEARVNLKLWVKVRKEWRDSELLIKNFGYRKED